MRAPPGYEAYNIDWSKLTPAMVAVICAFADALREIRENEIALLRLSTVDYLKAMCDAMRADERPRSVLRRDLDRVLELRPSGRVSPRKRT